MHLVVDGIIFEYPNIGGISRIYYNILPLICNIDPNLKITLFFTRKPLIDFPLHNQITIIHLENVYNFLRPWRLWFPYYKKIQALILKLYIGNSKDKIWLSTYFSRPPFKWHGKEIVWVYDLIHELFSHIYPNSERTIKNKKQAISCANKILCISHSTANDLQKFYNVPENKIMVNYLSHNATIKCKSCSDDSQNKTEKYILYIGKRVFYKGFDTLLTAYSKWKKNRDIKLYVIGSSWSSSEINLLQELRVYQQVILWKNPDDETLISLYEHAEAFVYPSFYEGFGIPLLEAMACACPVIASRIPSTVEIACDIPFYFEPGDSDDLVNTFNQLLDSEELQNRIKVGKHRASQFSWEKTAKNFYESLKELYKNI